MLSNQLERVHEGFGRHKEVITICEMRWLKGLQRYNSLKQEALDQRVKNIGGRKVIHV